MRELMMILVLLLGTVSFANNDNTKKRIGVLDLNPRAKYRVGLNLYAFGPVGEGGASLDVFLTRKINLEIGAGARNYNPDLGFFAGAKYHFLGKTSLRTTPYLGIFSGFEYRDNDLRNYNLYIPFGIQRINRKGFAWSLEVAYQENSDNPSQRFYGGGKIGFRF